MRLMIIATGFYSYGEALMRAFEKLGFEVSLVNMEMCKDSILKRIYSKFFQLCNSRIGSDLLYLSPPWWRRKESKRILSEYRRINPDMVISFPAYDLQNKVIEEMKDIEKVIWIYDGVKSIPNIISKLELYDNIFVFEKGDVNYLRENGLNSYFLPLCADNSIYYKKENVEKTVDISFVGKISEDRFLILNNLIEWFPNCKMEFYGKIPHGIIRNIKKYGITRIPKEFRNINISPEGANDLYNRSKICINIHKAQSRYGGNMRLYETLAAGAFQITDVNEYIKDNFSNAVATFINADDLREKIEYYMMHENERMKIADYGHKLVNSTHLFVNRAYEILEKSGYTND